MLKMFVFTEWHPKSITNAMKFGWTTLGRCVGVGQKDVSPLMDHLLSIKELVKYFFPLPLGHPSLLTIIRPFNIYRYPGK